MNTEFLDWYESILHIVFLLLVEVQGVFDSQARSVVLNYVKNFKAYISWIWPWLPQIKSEIQLAHSDWIEMLLVWGLAQ